MEAYMVERRTRGSSRDEFSEWRPIEIRSTKSGALVALHMREEHNRQALNLTVQYRVSRWEWAESITWPTANV
jgi:hypothetical protein